MDHFNLNYTFLSVDMFILLSYYDLLDSTCYMLLQELKIVLKDVPEIVEVVGSADANQVLDVSEEDGKEKVKSVLQSIFTQLMSANKEMVSKIITKLKIRLQMESQVSQFLLFLDFSVYHNHNGAH